MKKNKRDLDHKLNGILIEQKLFVISNPCIYLNAHMECHFPNKHIFS